MTLDDRIHRRALFVYYRRYANADRAWRIARREALSWFPPEARPAVPPIGDPGSRLRRLYDRRDQALARLSAALREWHAFRRGVVSRRIPLLALPPR